MQSTSSVTPVKSDYDDLLTCLFKPKPHPAHELKKRTERRVELMKVNFKDAYSGKHPKMPSEKALEESYHKRNQTITEKMNRMAFERQERTMSNRDFLFQQMKEN